MTQNKTFRIVRLACGAIIISSLTLELLPRSFFDSAVSLQLIHQMLSNSSLLMNAYVKSEQLYPGYGNKLVASHVLLSVVFLTVTYCTIYSTLNANPKVNVPSGLKVERNKRLLLLGISLVSIIALQFLWFGFFISSGGGKASAAPFLSRGITLAAAIIVIGAIVVLWRRGQWSDAN